MCTVLLPPGVNPIAVNKYINININFHLVQKHPNRLRDSTSLLFNGYPGSFPGVQRLGRDVDLLHLSRTKVKNKRSYTSTPSIRLRGVETDSFSYFLNSYVPFCYIKLLAQDKASECIREIVGSKLGLDAVRLFTVFLRRLRQILSIVLEIWSDKLLP